MTHVSTAHNTHTTTHKHIMKRVAYIHKASTGYWHISDNEREILSEEGIGHDTERAAIKSARHTGWFTHRIDLKGRLQKI